MARASGKGQGVFGIAAIVRARLSAASDFDSTASFPASDQGSKPRRANTESMFRAVPLGSVPISAYRNWFRSDRPSALTSEVATNFPEICNPSSTTDDPHLQGATVKLLRIAGAGVQV